MSTDSAPAENSHDENDDRLARILDDYLVAVERGDDVTPDALFARYPEDTERLRGYLSGLQLFHLAIAPHRSPPSPLMLDTLAASQSVGDFQIVREIGRGGMGVVYEAWQESLHRRVALKILPFTVANDAKQIGRFKNEAQAAAQVQHPNIVPVYAVGEQNGMHYYAMQVIDGQSLASMLTSLRSGRDASHGTTAPNNSRTVCNELTGPPRSELLPVEEVAVQLNASETADHLRAIARLGIQAAEALHAAHEYGVVHRDIKPSNLLLDDHGKLWITDFGLARCRDDAGLTQTGDVLGTMRYMSPEQARGQHAAIDHRSDIYSLGLTLYELASLHHPAEGVGDLPLYFERDQRPPKPLKHWNRHIGVDFQTIVLKALSEAPNERYASAQELADDLQRFLEGKPILASPPRAVTRVHKWLRRHRRIVSAAAAVVLIASTVCSLILMRQQTTTNRLNDQLTQANEQLIQRGRQIHDRVDRLAMLADQLAAIPGAEGARQQLLDDLLSMYHEIEAQAVDDPALATDVATAYSKSGSLFEKMGDQKRALESHQMALNIWQERAVNDPDNIEYARNLALCQNNLGFLLGEMGHTSQAAKLLSAALETQQSLHRNSSNDTEIATDIATTHSNLGLVCSRIAKKDEAVGHFRVAIDLLQPLANASTVNENPLRTLAASYCNLAALEEADKPSDADDAYQKAVAIQQRLAKAYPLNRIHQADLARTYNNLGYFAGRRGDWRKAELCCGDAIKLQENLKAASPAAGAYRRDLAISCNNMGMVQSRLNRWKEAQESFRRAIELQDGLLAVRPNDAQALSNRGSVLNNLGLLLDKQHRYSDAETAYRQAVRDQSSALTAAPGDNRVRALVSQHYDNLTKNLELQSKHDEATTVTIERQHLLSNNVQTSKNTAAKLDSAYSQMEP